MKDLEDIIQSSPDLGPFKDLLGAIDISWVKGLIRAVEPHIEIHDEEDVLRWYLSDARNAIHSLNSFFDEMFYRRSNPDVVDAILKGQFFSGLIHYILYGIKEGRPPNERLAERLKGGFREYSLAECVDDLPYQARVAAEYSEFRRAFRRSNIVDFYNGLLRKIIGESYRPGFDGLARSEFDPEYFREQFPEMSDLPHDALFYTYLRLARDVGASPNREFDEKFYLAFNYDVRNAVSNGDLHCGFEHYLFAGRSENRLAKYSQAKAIELKYPGLSEPVGLERLVDLEQKFSFPYVKDESAPSLRVNFVLPDLNPDIFFGGYDTVINLIKHFLKNSYHIRIIKTESYDSSLEYLKFHWERKGKFADFRDLEVLSRSDLIKIASNDRFIAYSVWDTLIAREFAKLTTCHRVVALVQEYEPIFTDFNALHFLSNSAYLFDTYPIYNSNILKKYFEAHRLGPFRSPVAEIGRDFNVFEHVITKIPLGNLEPKGKKTLFFYARPERHAGRNIFEIGIMALRRVIKSMHPDALNQWRFIGVGALSDGLSAELAPNIEMKIHAKLPVEEYMALMRDVDVCLSLMWAPHPSVVPFELLQTGALVVTNEFSNRSMHELREMSCNLIPAECTLEGIVEALKRAFDLVDDYALRKRGAKRIGPESWAEAFNNLIPDLQRAEIL